MKRADIVTGRTRPFHSEDDMIAVNLVSISKPKGIIRSKINLQLSQLRR